MNTSVVCPDKDENITGGGSVLLGQGKTKLLITTLKNSPNPEIRFDDGYGGKTICVYSGPIVGTWKVDSKSTKISIKVSIGDTITITKR